MTERRTNSIFFITICILLFLVDIGLFIFLQKPIFTIIDCYTIFLLSKTINGNKQIIFPLFLSSLLSYLHYDIFGLSLTYLVPTVLLAQYLAKQIRITVVIPFLLFFSMLIYKIIVLSYRLQIHYTLQSYVQITLYNLLFLILLIFYDNYSNKK